MKLIRKANSVFDGIVNAFAVVAGVILVGLMLAVSAQALGRTFWNITWPSLMESAQVSLLYITFLGTTWVMRNERHVSMDIVTARVSPKTNLIMNISTSIICALLCLVLFWYSAEVVWVRWQSGVWLYRNFPILDAQILMIIPVGTLFLFIQLLKRTGGFVKKLRGIQKAGA
jgi:TRAP-type C4-dicarboxylate transport system permease small subunit